ncbi:uncharacterized protein [Nicotiana tomentosiformis]|uniref:uncharacterized protein n=1 Tax=Nicotiana tomentosiformis TaxID=4098 RepID=UPI00051C7714|nr:uncharacterized protein LOC104088934 [Nicotiana tomentosiformis]
MAEISEFHKCIENCGLLEFPTTCSRYTWNDRHGDKRIMSRIDWAFINSAWLNNMISFRAQFLQENISDHCLLELTPYSAQRKNKHAFKFCNVWSSYPDFLEVVKEGWMQSIQGCNMFQVVKKKKLLKVKFKNFSRRYFSDIVERADEDRLALAKIQAELHRNPFDTRIQQAWEVLFQRFKRSSYLTEVYLQQRSKVTWLKLDDDNNIYFFSVIKHRKLQQAVLQLTVKLDRMVTDQQEIANVFVEYYQELLGTKGSNRITAF